MDNWDGWANYLPRAPLEPQELDILGSVKAPACLKFNYTGKNRTKFITNVTASLTLFKNESVWCNYTTSNTSKSLNAPLTLPTGIFLICGDRAWQGVPSHLVGGPCTLGHLTLLTPNTSMILNITKIHKREKRSINTYQEKCSDNVYFWQADKTIIASFLAPGVAAAQALTTLNKLGCWLAKQNNATSAAISALLVHTNSIRHATLQNRAATDFFIISPRSWM